MSVLSQVVAEVLSSPASQQEAFLALTSHNDVNVVNAVDAFKKVSSIVSDVEAGKTFNDLAATLIKHGSDFTAIMADIKSEPLPLNVKAVLEGPTVTEAVNVFPVLLGWVQRLTA